MAGSYRIWPQSGLKGVRGSRRATDWGFRRGNLSVSCPTPNTTHDVDLGSRGVGVSPASERGTTLTTVKVPKNG